MNNWLISKKKVVFAATLALLISIPSFASAVQVTPDHNSLVPLRVIAESLGAQLEWEGITRTITLERDATSIVLTVGQDQAMINSEKVTLDQKVQIIDGRTFVPNSFITSAFGSQVEWNADDKTISLKHDDYAGRASAFARGLFQGDVNTIKEHMNDALKLSLPEQTLGLYSQQIPAVFGQPNKRLSAILDKNLVHTNVKLVYETTQSPFEIVVRFDTSGLVDDLSFAAVTPTVPYSKPDYDQGNYTEQQVVVGEGTFALPGTLTLPQGDGPFPAVILVHGSGPNDQDSTIGGTKIFKDLSVGLASQGVAVLRYEKISKVHTTKVSTTPQFTLKNESVDDVIRAVELLKHSKGIDSSRIYVAGHSQGGYVMPLVIDSAQKGDIAGAILLSAPSEQFTDVVIEQQELALERLKQLDFPEEIIAQQKQAVTMWTSVAELVQNTEFSKDNLPANFPIPPAYWWYEQRDYVPTELAKEQIGPILILQGENDWQVSMNQFDGWKKALQHRSDIVYKSYPDVNHLLTEYGSLSVGMEYGVQANVSVNIIKDISEWVNR